MSKPTAKPRKIPKPDPRRARAGEELQRHLGHSFQNPRLLEQALTHRSYSAQNNERFEFVGDAILDYSVAKMLFDAFPGYSEGELSRLRANLVNQDVLAEIARSMGVGDALYLGVGELKSGGFDRPSILADAVEALQARRLPLPKYRIEHQSGEGCDARFDIACDLGELAHITRAQAASRRAAEQAAAKEALDWLQEHHPLPGKNKKHRQSRA